MGTPGGTTIPTRGSLYVYSTYRSSSDAPTGRSSVPVKWIGNVGIVEQEEIADDLFKITYHGEHGSQLVVGEGKGSARYTLADSWQAPTQAPFAVGIERVKTPRCSYRDVLRVTLDQPTAAVRIRWTFDDLTTEWILPTEDGTSKWLPSVERHVLEIGTRACAGTTVPPYELATGGTLELIAIRLDGSEVAVKGLPSTISFRDVATVDELRETLNAMLRERHAAEQTPRKPALSKPDRLVLSLLLLLAGFGFGRWWLEKALASLS